MKHNAHYFAWLLHRIDERRREAEKCLPIDLAKGTVRMQQGVKPRPNKKTNEVVISGQAQRKQF